MQNNVWKKILPYWVLLGLLLVACTPTQLPESVILDYLEAKVAGDRAQIQSLVCSSLESEVDTFASEFDGLDARLENIACSVQSQGSSNAEVSCTGGIAVTYGNEGVLVDLNDYILLWEDGAWRMCGETSP